MPKLIRFDVFEADLAAGQLRKRGSKVNLREKSFRVLASLLEHPGQVVTREDLHRRLWPDDVFVDFDNNLNAAIAKLRETLGDSAEHPRFIETLPKHGYRFLSKVTEAARVPEPAPKVRLVVLPFLNLSGIPEKEYFSDAMTDEIITELARILPDQFAVIARTTAMHYKGSHDDVARIARELNVDYVVEGGVHQTDGRFRMTVQLIRTTDQAHVWAQRLDAELRDIFQMQSSVAHAIAAQVGIASGRAKVRVGDARGRRAKRQPTKDLVAYKLYLEGRHDLYTWSPDSAAKARQYLEQAIGRDPEFALAYDSLGELYWSLGFYGFMPPKEACSMGLCYALRAVEIDNDLAETHALLGRYRKQVDFNWPEAQREMSLALQLNPASPVVIYRYATSYLMPQGRLAEATAELEKVLEYDPLDLNVRAWLGALHWIGGHYEWAVEQLRLVFEIDPNYPLGHLVLGQTRLMEHKFEEAIAVLRKALELHGGSPTVQSWLGLALAQSGNTSEARSLLSRLHAIAAQAYVPPTCFAWIHYGLGEIEEAFVWMDRAIEARDHMMTPIKSYPFLDPIRSDPRFAALLRKMRLEA